MAQFRVLFNPLQAVPRYGSPSREGGALGYRRLFLIVSISDGIFAPHKCLDHVFVFNARHLQKTVDEFIQYYNTHRPHRSLNHQPPCPAVMPIPTGPPTAEVIAEPVLGGLHHVYQRAA